MGKRAEDDVNRFTKATVRYVRLSLSQTVSCSIRNGLNSLTELNYFASFLTK